MNGRDDGYRVDLDVFSGPLDLLLHLIKKDEIDIYDIPISRILQQYLAHLEVLKLMELDEVGDFLVMAANLMLIKEILGHSSLSTTQKYTHVTAEAMKKAYQTAHPRSGSTK